MLKNDQWHLIDRVWVFWRQNEAELQDKSLVEWFERDEFGASGVSPYYNSNPKGPEDECDNVLPFAWVRNSTK